MSLEFGKHIRTVFETVLNSGPVEHSAPTMPRVDR